MMAASPRSGRAEGAAYRRSVRRYYDAAEEELGRGEQPDRRTLQPIWLEHGGPDKERLTNISQAERAGIRPGDRVLDAGCGTGGPMVDIARHIPGVHIEGVNLSRAQVDRARARIREAGLDHRLRVRDADFHRLPFTDDSFDVVLFLESLGHSDDIPRALAEARRVLRPGGILYIKDSLSRDPPLTPSQRRDLERYRALAPGWAPPMSELVSELRTLGFADIEPRDLSDAYETGLFHAVMAEQHGLRDVPVFTGDTRAKKPAVAPDGPVYAIGALGYDFGTEARRDTFKQRMPAARLDGVRVPALPYDARQMADYLDAAPAEASALIWTLELERTPIYAIEPEGAFAADVYARFSRLLRGQLGSGAARDAIARVSMPGWRTGRSARLMSGQIVPVVSVRDTRGLYGWRRQDLLDAVLAAVPAARPDADDAARRSLDDFLARVYHELRNPGQTPRERALNFAATNAFQTAVVIREAVARGLELSRIDAQPGPACRPDSACWDVTLRFFDPDNVRRAERVFRFTVDVRDSTPVTLGRVRSWSTAR